MALLWTLALMALSVSATVHFQEDFNDGDAWAQRWVVSTNKGDEAGKFDLDAGPWYGDEKEDIGLHTSEDARFYQTSAAFKDSFSNKDKDLVLQYSVRHPQHIDCGGGYIKLLPGGFDAEDFNGDTPYNIMFGPDICGATKRTHVIFNYKGENHLLKKEIPCPFDEYSHLYTLIVHPDNTYEVKIDGESKQTGSLKDDWDMLLPREIEDPEASKPEDWVDDAQMPDPDDVKPDGWDDIPAQIADADAEKPDDWDDELDGVWEPPMIDNPEYKGEWKPKMIDNPDYKGPWVHPKIDNPDFVDDDTLYSYDDHSAVGLEIWQVKAGTIFDRFLVTDSVEEAAAAEEKFLEAQKAEKEMGEEVKEKQREEAEEARKAAEEEAEANGVDLDDEDIMEEDIDGHDEL